MSKATLQIIEQLKETSHPPIVLLDGAWGIGKTHLVEKELRPILEKDSAAFGSYHYMSIFGISSTTEFLDQVISLFLSGETVSTEALKSLAPYISKVAKIFGADDSQAGLIKGAISGVSGVIRQKVIKEMAGFTLVVDDLERLTDESLIADIMGICLRLAEKNNIKIIVVANLAALKNKTKVEKTFSDIIKLSLPTEKLTKILLEIYGEKLPPQVKEFLPTLLTRLQSAELEVNNLRVLKRALNRVIKIVEKVSRIQDIDTPRNIEMLIENIIIVMLYSYTHKMNMDDYVSVHKNMNKYETVMPNSSNEKEPTEEELLQKNLQNQLNSLLNGQSCSDALIEYCFTNVLPGFEDSKFIDRFGLLRHAKPIDLFKTGSFYRCNSEDEFQQGLSDLKELLFKTSNTPWPDWIGCCDTYLYLIEQDYFKDKNIDEESKRLINRMLEPGSIDLKTAYEESLFGRGAGLYQVRNLSEHIKTYNFSHSIEELAKKAQTEIKEVIINQFLNDWNTAYKPHSNIEHQAFFHTIETERFITAIIDHWKPIEIVNFGRYIEQRYRITNNAKKDTLELPALEKLLQQLTQKHKELTEILLKGTVGELMKGINQAIAVIKERHK
jgi:hypothetical protein